MLDYEASEGFVTPTWEFADFTAFVWVPYVEVAATVTPLTGVVGAGVTVHLRNPSDRLAFAIELRIVDPSTDRSILPVLLDDNYFALLPGEEREITARFPQTEDLGGAVLEVAGWNVPETTVELQ